MKKAIILLLFFFAFVTTIHAQKIDKYCEVVCYLKTLSVERCNPHIQLGEIDSLLSFKDPSVVESLKKVNKFNTRTDVLNYMSRLGWTLVSTNTLGSNALGTNTHYFIFKKSFDQAELNMP